MWQKIKEFSAKDPLIFTIIIAIIVVGGGFAAVQSMHMTSSAEFCKTCHPKEEIGVRGEYHTYRMGVHSEAGVSCLDCHGAPGIQGYLNAHVVAGMRSMYHEILTPEEDVIKHLTEFGTTVEGAEHAASEEACLFCHSDVANEEMRRNRIIKVAGEFRHMDEVVMPAYREEFGRNDVFEEGVSAGVEPNHKAHIEAGLSCMNCHLGVGHSGERFKKPEMDTCFTCHDEIRETVAVPANDDCAACHTNQKGIQEGTYAKGVEGDRWYMADLSCTDCHADAFTRPNTDTCVTCHEDASYGTMMIDTQKAFNAKLPAAIKLRDEMMEARHHASEGQRKIANDIIYLVRVLENDGSAGVHNPEYFDAIFEKVAEFKEAYANYVEHAEHDAPEKLIMAKGHGDTVRIGHGEEEHAAPAEEHAEEAHAEPAGPANSAELMAMLEGAEQINLGERYAPHGKKKAVVFEHKAHAEKLECTNCHVEAGDNALKVAIPAEVEGTNNVFHKELCITCHKEKKVKKGTSCNTCHK